MKLDSGTVEIGFRNPNKNNGTTQKKMKKFNASDTGTPGDSLENPERVKIGDCNMCFWVKMNFFIHENYDTTLNNTKPMHIVGYVLRIVS